MEAKDLILNSLEQSQRYLTKTLDGLTQEEAAWSPGPECNSIAFILWHITRVEDYIVNNAVQSENELYEADGWREKLGTPAEERGSHYTLEQLQAWPVPKIEILQGYANSVRQKTLAFLNSSPPEKLSEAIQGDPYSGPITYSGPIDAILCFMSTEIALHVGQIDYLRGVQRGLDK